ncbi:hypothetical protein AJ88_30055 [Mesorhizobium amorphae CCBAU 01583]|nr:hypothetical protein AJ88_30055 [Mesorhizobium amorphae CCBAU 01583]
MAQDAPAPACRADLSLALFRPHARTRPDRATGPGLADPQIALEIYYGRYPLSGHMVETGGKSPFQIAVPNRGWQKTLHGFRWLRHMRAAGTELAAANARALVSDWIAIHGNQISGIAWEPGTTAKRVIAWLQHSSVVLQGAEFPFYRAFLKSLAMQIRYLRSMAREMPDGKDRLRAVSRSPSPLYRCQRRHRRCAAPPATWRRSSSARSSRMAAIFRATR